ncbi:exo-alpha-sialidase [Devosia algicola]|uniref:exo-alpha-sialidase n=1 Tax=Devosia algicola TaxID=3026418 RepID=UPI003899493F
MVVLGNGTWLLPVFHCRPVPGERWHGHNDVSAVKLSSDRGKSWKEYEVPNSLGAVHMNVVDRGNGRLLAFYRSRYADHILRSVSTDFGKSWTAPSATDQPNNNSSIQVRALSDGALALVFNSVNAAAFTDRRYARENLRTDGGKPHRFDGQYGACHAPH